MNHAKATIHPNVHLHRVSKYLYSHFIEHLGQCVYGGIWVGPDSKIENDHGIRTDVVEAVKKIAPPVIRWPGGCFADTYHWRDGIGPRAERPRRYNVWWCRPETNEFGTDEFMRFCGMVGAEPYICLNLGSGTVEEAMQWVEYCNSEQDTTVTRMRRANGLDEPYNVKFWGIGNENWACGGNMLPEYYADRYMQFATFIRQMERGDVKLVACGSHKFLPDWDARVLRRMKDPDHMRSKYGFVDLLGIHIYSHGLSHGSRPRAADEVAEDQYYSFIAEVDTMGRHIERACAVAQGYTGRVKIAMDEWGTWYEEAKTDNGLRQKNSMVDALFAAATFHCCHKHENLFMTNIAQMINVLQSMAVTQGRKMFTTTTYHVYDLFMPHRENALVPVDVESPALPIPEPALIGTLSGCPRTPRDAISVSATATPDKKKLFISLLNLHLAEDAEVAIGLSGDSSVCSAQARRLVSDSVCDGNTFEEPDKVAPKDIDVDIAGDSFALTLPAHSITTIDMTLA